MGTFVGEAPASGIRRTESTNPTPWGWILIFLAILVAVLALLATWEQTHTTTVTAAETFTKSNEVGTVTVLTTPGNDGTCKFDANFASNLIRAFSAQGSVPGSCDDALRQGLTDLHATILHYLEDNPGIWEGDWQLFTKTLKFLYDLWLSLS